VPPHGSAIELVLINAQRQLWRVDGYFFPHSYLTEAVGPVGSPLRYFDLRCSGHRAPHRRRACTAQATRAHANSRECLSVADRLRMQDADDG